MKILNGSVRQKHQSTNISGDMIVLSEDAGENSDGKDGHDATGREQFRRLSTVDSIDCDNDMLRTASSPSLAHT